MQFRPVFYEVFRVLVTAQAPLHFEIMNLTGERHLFDRSVTRAAGNPVFNMNAVVKINEIGQVRNAAPFERPAAGGALANGLKHGTVFPDFAVAIHAELGVGHGGLGFGLDALMAIAAVDAEVRHVMLMAERHRLRMDRVGVGDVRRSIDETGQDQETSQAEGTRQERPTKKTVSAFGKLHRHFKTST
jgi:hypothetical protein